MVKRVESLYNETRKFSGLEGSRFGECPAFERARVLKIGNMDVIYQQGYSRDGPYVLIPGYLVSGIIIGESGRYCSVFPIKDESERGEIEKLLTEKIKGYINFWD